MTIKLYHGNVTMVERFDNRCGVVFRRGDSGIFKEALYAGSDRVQLARGKHTYRWISVYHCLWIFDNSSFLKVRC